MAQDKLNQANQQRQQLQKRSPAQLKPAKGNFYLSAPLEN